MKRLALFLAGFLSFNPAFSASIELDISGLGPTPSFANGDIQLGTLDAFGRPQIWNKANGSILRLGSSIVDGDATNVDSNGVVVYQPSMDYYSRFKADAVALRHLSTASDYFHVDATTTYYNQGVGGAGQTVFYANRTNGRVGIGTSAPSAPLSVSTSAASTNFLSFAGAFQTLPTTGYAEGTLAYQLSDHKLYVATETVSVAGSWVAAF